MANNIGPETVASRVATIKVRVPPLADMAQWVGDLLSESINASELFPRPNLDIDPEAAREGFAKGIPLLDLRQLELDPAPVRTLLARLVTLTESLPESGEQVLGMRRLLDDDGLDAEMLKAALDPDSDRLAQAAAKYTVEPMVLALFLGLAMRPYLAGLAEAVAVAEQVDFSGWARGNCPVCGSWPKLADLSGEGGRRTLHCARCETAWTFARLQCPFCDSEDQRDLGYFKAAEEEGIRVDFCRKCGQYLKTIDLREMAGPIIVPLDDVATMHLDLAAHQELSKSGIGPESS